MKSSFTGIEVKYYSINNLFVNSNNILFFPRMTQVNQSHVVTIIIGY